MSKSIAQLVDEGYDCLLPADYIKLLESVICELASGRLWVEYDWDAKSGSYAYWATRSADNSLIKSFGPYSTVLLAALAAKDTI